MRFSYLNFMKSGIAVFLVGIVVCSFILVSSKNRVQATFSFFRDNAQEKHEGLILGEPEETQENRELSGTTDKHRDDAGEDDSKGEKDDAGEDAGKDEKDYGQEDKQEEKRKYIKWVDFKVTYEALCLAYDWDVKTHDTQNRVHWIELLSYGAAKTGGSFDKKTLKCMEQCAQKIAAGDTTMEALTGGLKYYPYYLEAYSAALGGLVGEYEAEETDEQGNVTRKTKYGLKAFFPLARGFDYSHYDDFGAGRSYGYKRKHLGHDMMGLVGTPIVAIESGTVEAIGWNRYGGWRVGIRSFDKKRYYYYAHLRQNYPYAEGLEEGSVVTAGDVIGYMGHTGYSDKENVNNIEVTHLHWGLELIFDESQKESDNEIWIDVYALTRFLSKHTQPVEKIEGTKHWRRITGIKDPLVEATLEENKDTDTKFP